MPTPELHLKLSQSFAYTRCDIAIISVEVNMCVKTNNFDGVFFHHFQWGIERTSAQNGC
jgi:uncharacterized membrane protein